MNIKEKIEKYKPFNEQEESDKKQILEYINTFDDVLTRKNKMCHFTASNWIINKERTKILMVYHNIFKSWAWTGGHADGDSDLIHVALKEAKEETGINDLKLLINDLYGFQIVAIDGHIKNGEFVSPHLHLDCVYLWEANETENLRIKEDENCEVKWVDIDEVVKVTTQVKMKAFYQKYIDKMKYLKQ